MDIERKRVAGNSSRNGVVMGSVWESRMSGSFKVFNGDNDKIQQLEKPIEKNQSSDELVEKDKIVLRSKQSFNGVKNGVGKRKTWKSDGGNNEGNERNPSQISKVRSDGNGIKKSPLKKERSPVERTIKTRALSRKSSIDTNLVPISDESNHEVEEISKDEDDDDGEELGVVCEEKLITNEIVKVENEDSKQNDEEQEEEEGCNKKATLDENEMVNEERAIVIVKEMEPISKINNKKKEESEMEPISKINNKKKKKESLDDDDDDVVVIEEKKIHQRNERSNPISKTIKTQPSPPVVNHPRIISKPNEFPSQRVPKSHNKLQTFIDLIMWRDASKSALIFGVGTFSIISSSYTQDLNISFISVISYLGLIYLAAIFIFRSFLLRGVVEDNNNNIIDDEESVVGEEEALWALKLFLPYINEFLLKVKALFSGDPATTMKLAVLLFILARCGSSITIWKMTKLAFFGVFTVPKICSSYSSQLTAYGTFWVERFKDAWESCSQKKAVAFGVFTLVWNLSSIVARIWAVFMLLVAFKYYQQSMVKDEVVKEEEAEQEEPITRRNQSSWQEQRNRNKGLSTESTKLRKRS